MYFNRVFHHKPSFFGIPIFGNTHMGVYNHSGVLCTELDHPQYDLGRCARSMRRKWLVNPEPVRCPIRPLLMMANLPRSMFKETPEEQLEAWGLPLSLTKAMITIGETPIEPARLLGREGSPIRSVWRALHPLWYTVDETLSAFARTRET